MAKHPFSLSSRLTQYLTFGVVVLLLILAVVAFSYILIFGALIGVVLFAISYVKQRWFNTGKGKINQPGKTNRTIDHDSD